MVEVSVEHGAPLPFRGQERWWKVFGVRGHAEERIRILSDRWWGQWFHWTGHESFPCEMNDKCLLCKDRDPNRWCGYVAAQVGTEAVEAVFGLSAHACRMMEPELKARGTLRGTEWRLQRKKPKDPGKKLKKNDRVEAFLLRVFPALTLRQPFPVLPSLQRLWGIQSVRRAEGVVVNIASVPGVSASGFDYGKMPDEGLIPY